MVHSFFIVNYLSFCYRFDIICTYKLSGKIKLTGTYHYYSREQKTIEQYDIYLTLQNEELSHFPLMEGTDSKFPLNLAIKNGLDKADLFGSPGTNGKITGSFDNLILNFIPGKPAESEIEILSGTIENESK